MNDRDKTFDLSNISNGISTAQSVIPRSRRTGALGVAWGGVSAAAEIAGSGRLSNQTIGGLATSAATMIGARLIPGVGWIMLGHTALDLGSRAILGKPFGDTMIGKPIEWVAGKAGRGALSLATGMTDIVGWKSGSDFLQNTLKPWAFSEDKSTSTALIKQQEAVSRGLLPSTNQPILTKGPASPMQAADWHEHPPISERPSPALTARHMTAQQMETGKTLPSIMPDPSDINHRRQELLTFQSQIIDKSFNRDVSKDREIQVDGIAANKSEIINEAKSFVTKDFTSIKEKSGKSLNQEIERE